MFVGGFEEINSTNQLIYVFAGKCIILLMSDIIYTGFHTVTGFNQYQSYFRWRQIYGIYLKIFNDNRLCRLMQIVFWGV